MKVYIYTDGASRGNPGESASGYLILDASHSLICERVFYNGVCTNNVAEYSAIIAALKKALSIGSEEIVLHSDSQLVVNQLSGGYKVRNKGLRSLNSDAKALLKKFKSYELLNVPRENREISAVDKKLNSFLDRKFKEKYKYSEE
jgi:ribonuclease HI